MEGLVGYVAYRDRAAPQGRLFDRERTVGDRERLDFLRYVRQSIKERESTGKTPGKAVYRLVISPEDARGLDLRQLTRQTVGRLERDLGPAKQLRWIAAEHHNTAHPHVHVVLAAQREVEGGYRSFLITKPRLARMKETLHFELERQRGERLPRQSVDERLRDLTIRGRPQKSRKREAWQPGPERRRPQRALSLGLRIGLRRLAYRYQSELVELEREERQRGGGRER